MYSVYIQYSMFTQRTYYTEYTENKANFSIRPRTDFSILVNRARCLWGNKKCDCNLLNNRFLKKKSITMGNDIETSELL